MNIQILQTQAEQLDINISGISLLSDELYSKNKDHIPPYNGEWWLCSAYYGIKSFAAFVNSDGALDYMHANHEFGVRPVITAKNLSGAGIRIGDRFSLLGYTWTVVAEDCALCDGSIGQCCFRKDWQADNANDYDASDIKEYLADWWEQQTSGI